MKSMRNVGILMLVLGGAFLALSPRRRLAVARKLAEARRFVPWRAADREARASHLASETWEGEGGAFPAIDQRH
jgi:hypothetical protein